MPRISLLGTIPLLWTIPLLFGLCFGTSIGCGRDVESLAVVVSPSVQQGIASVTNFGDSLTCGLVAQPNNGTGFVYSTNGYAGLLDSAIARPAQNFCRGGDQAADMARVWVYPNAVPALGAKQLYTAIIGDNDALVCGVSSACLANFTQALSASIAWLTLPATDKVLAQSMAATGTWIADSSFSYGQSATGAGNTLSFNSVQTMAGHPLYVAYRVFSSGGGTAIVSVDGVAEATLSATGNDGLTVATQNGTPDAIFLVSVPLGATGSHQVSITTTASQGVFSVLWAGVASADYRTVPGSPRLVIGSPPPTRLALGAAFPTYRSIIAELVDGFSSAGSNVQMAPTATAFDPSTDLGPDGLHPNNTGHLKLALAMNSVL
jgi:lysophospholipase L1-like esterase